MLAVMESSLLVDLVVVSSLADNNRLKQKVTHAKSSYGSPQQREDEQMARQMEHSHLRKVLLPSSTSAALAPIQVVSLKPYCRAMK